MELGAIFLILALAVVIGLFVSRPFLNSETIRPSKEQLEEADPTAHKRSALLAERDRLLNSLQELDFDHGLGKIPAEDYPPQRTILLQRAANVLRELDSLGEAGPGVSAEERVEQAVAVRRADGQLKPELVAQAPGVPAVFGTPAGRDDDIEMLIASRRKQRQEKSGGFCPNCGRPVQKSDKFCSNCGAVVS
jgi:hypothetical protein